MGPPAKEAAREDRGDGWRAGVTEWVLIRTTSSRVPLLPFQVVTILTKTQVKTVLLLVWEVWPVREWGVMW